MDFSLLFQTDCYYSKSGGLDWEDQGPLSPSLGPDNPKPTHKILW